MAGDSVSFGQLKQTEDSNGVKEEKRNNGGEKRKGTKTRRATTIENRMSISRITNDAQ